jgi:hypothetical protein
MREYPLGEWRNALRCSARRLLVEKKAAEIEAAKQQEKDPELVAAQ